METEAIMSRSGTARTGTGDRGEVVGVFRRAAGGYGFVRPLDAGASARREGDVHVAQTACLDAVSGDTVRVRLSRTRDFRRPGPAGEIVEVVARAKTRFVGSFFVAAGAGTAIVVSSYGATCL